MLKLVLDFDFLMKPENLLSKVTSMPQNLVLRTHPLITDVHHVCVIRAMTELKLSDNIVMVVDRLVRLIHKDIIALVPSQSVLLPTALVTEVLILMDDVGKLRISTLSLLFVIPTLSTVGKDVLNLRILRVLRVLRLVKLLVI